MLGGALEYTVPAALQGQLLPFRYSLLFRSFRELRDKWLVTEEMICDLREMGIVEYVMRLATAVANE